MIAVIQRTKSGAVKVKEKIIGQVNLALKKIESEAYRKSQEIKGRAEAEAMNIYALSLKEDPEYYEFMRTLETYRSTLKGKNFILSTSSPFLNMLQKHY